MNAYHDDAVMSMHMAYPEWCGNVQGAEKLNEYMVRDFGSKRELIAYRLVCLNRLLFLIKHFICLYRPDPEI